MPEKMTHMFREKKNIKITTDLSSEIMEPVRMTTLKC